MSVGYAPISLGTDTTGSIIVPATRASLYGMRLTVGLVSTKGIVPVSKTFDTIGPMAKTVEDLTLVLNAITGNLGNHKYTTSSSQSWEHLRIGFLDPEVWHFPAFLSRPNAEADQQIVWHFYTTFEPFLTRNQRSKTLAMHITR